MPSSPTPDPETNRARLLVARAAQLQLEQAAQLIIAATANLRALRFGVEPALKHAVEAENSAAVAWRLVSELIKRIP